MKIASDLAVSILSQKRVCASYETATPFGIIIVQIGVSEKGQVVVSCANGYGDTLGRSDFDERFRSIGDGQDGL